MRPAPFSVRRFTQNCYNLLSYNERTLRSLVSTRYTSLLALLWFL